MIKKYVFIDQTWKCAFKHWNSLGRILLTIYLKDKLLKNEWNISK